MAGFLQRVRLTLEMIKFEHSVFALPFALTGALLAWRDQGFAREGLWMKLLWIVVAMVAARSVAMAFNRVLDADIDARNPRTHMRHLPSGALTRRFAWGFIAAWGLVFMFAARELNPLCFKLAPLALAIPMLYSFTKRFTSLSHLVLGFSLGIAPGRRVDRRPRLARPAHPVAHRRRHPVDRRLRHHLRLPGLRLRRRDRPLQRAAPLRHRRRSVDRAHSAPGNARVPDRAGPVASL